jgi:hypothetical protein
LGTVQTAGMEPGILSAIGAMLLGIGIVITAIWHQQ